MHATTRSRGHSRLLAVLLLVAALVATATVGGHTETAQGATSSAIYGTCSGQKQGVIKGDVTAKGHEGQWAATSLADALTSPRDPASGLPTGQIVHSPIKITMLVGPQAPKLINSLTTNENLTKCRFDFFRPTPSGTMENYLRIELSNASVASYALSGPATSTPQTTFTFTYQHIVRTWLLGGIVSTDDWGARPA